MEQGAAAANDAGAAAVARTGPRAAPGFARWGGAAPSHASLGFGPATPLPPGAPSAAQAASGLRPVGRGGGLP